MGFTVEDGKGKNGPAGVSADQRFEVSARTGSRLYYISKDSKTAFQIHGERTLSAAGAFQNVLHFSYTGDKQCYVEKITFGREDATRLGSNQAVFEVLTNTKYTSGGDVTIPVNLNRTSPDKGDVLAHSGTSTITVDQTNSEEMGDNAVSNSFTLDFGGAFILGRGEGFLVRAKSKNNNDICHATVTYREE